MSYFSSISTEGLIVSIEFIPVLIIIGFLNLQIYLINSRLLHSPEPTLKAGILNLTNLSTAALQKGVLIKTFFLILRNSLIFFLYSQIVCMIL